MLDEAIEVYFQPLILHAHPVPARSSFRHCLCPTRRHVHQGRGVDRIAVRSDRDRHSPWTVRTVAAIQVITTAAAIGNCTCPVPLGPPFFPTGPTEAGKGGEAGGQPGRTLGPNFGPTFGNTAFTGFTAFPGPTCEKCRTRRGTDLRPDVCAARPDTFRNWPDGSR